MANLFARGVQTSWLASLRRPTNQFIAAVREAERTQGRKLLGILARNARTAYGREHCFDQVASTSDWQARVPIVDYADLSPWVDLVASGEQGVLTRDEVLVLEPTAGTTGPPKLIPYTTALLSELSAATGPWLFEIYRKWPALLGTRSYWSASGPDHTGGHTSGGIPIGSDDDTPYFGPLEGWANARVVAGTSQAEDGEPHHATLGLLEAEDLGFISVWRPDDLLDLVANIEQNLEPLLADLTPARAANLRGAINSAGAVTVEALWPNLVLVSCWGGESSAEALASLRTLMPSVPIQAKGLVATEGVVTIPVGASVGALAAVASHFLEFQDLEDANGVPKLVHEVAEGARYSPILTTSGGFYRYRLADVVRCVGHTAGTPRFVVEGRLP